jgi:hypothetical protein
MEAAGHRVDEMTHANITAALAFRLPLACEF